MQDPFDLAATVIADLLNSEERSHLYGPYDNLRHICTLRAQANKLKQYTQTMLIFRTMPPVYSSPTRALIYL